MDGPRIVIDGDYFTSIPLTDVTVVIRPKATHGGAHGEQTVLLIVGYSFSFLSGSFDALLFGGLLFGGLLLDALLFGRLFFGGLLFGGLLFGGLLFGGLLFRGLLFRGCQFCLRFDTERGTPEMFPRLRVVGIFLNKNIFKILQNRVWSSGLCGGHESVVLLVCADFFVVSPCFFHAFLFILN